MLDPHPKSFLLNIYAGRNATEEALWQEQGKGADWQKLDAIRLPGFDGRVHLPLVGFWAAALAARQPRFEQQVEGLETIVKFGDTMQLRTVYTAVLEAQFD